MFDESRFLFSKTKLLDVQSVDKVTACVQVVYPPCVPVVFVSVLGGQQSTQSVPVQSVSVPYGVESMVR